MSCHSQPGLRMDGLIHTKPAFKHEALPEALKDNLGKGSTGRQHYVADILLVIRSTVKRALGLRAQPALAFL